MIDWNLKKPVLSLIFLITIFFSMTNARSQEFDPATLSDSVINQINALAAEKASRTPTQRKMDSQFLIALKQRRDDVLANTLPMLRAAVEIDPDDTTLWISRPA
jgi:hypothetical protein